jgi:hypothetical protein
MLSTTSDSHGEVFPCVYIRLVSRTSDIVYQMIKHIIWNSVASHLICSSIACHKPVLWCLEQYIFEWAWGSVLFVSLIPPSTLCFLSSSGLHVNEEKDMRLEFRVRVASSTIIFVRPSRLSPPHGMLIACDTSCHILISKWWWCGETRSTIPVVVVATNFFEVGNLIGAWPTILTSRRSVAV